jgi:hypothetical protein
VYRTQTLNVVVLAVGLDFVLDFDVGFGEVGDYLQVFESGM